MTPGSPKFEILWRKKSDHADQGEGDFAPPATATCRLLCSDSTDVSKVSAVDTSRDWHVVWRNIDHGVRGREGMWCRIEAAGLANPMSSRGNALYADQEVERAEKGMLLWHQAHKIIGIFLDDKKRFSSPRCLPLLLMFAY